MSRGSPRNGSESNPPSLELTLAVRTGWTGQHRVGQDTGAAKSSRRTRINRRAYRMRESCPARKPCLCTSQRMRHTDTQLVSSPPPCLVSLACLFFACSLWLDRDRVLQCACFCVCTSAPLNDLRSLGLALNRLCLKVFCLASWHGSSAVNDRLLISFRVSALLHMHTATIAQHTHTHTRARARARTRTHVSHVSNQKISIREEEGGKVERLSYR